MAPDPICGMTVDEQTARSAIRELLSLAPPVARVVRHGEEREVPLDDVPLDDVQQGDVCGNAAERRSRRSPTP